jgi:threonine/homoserine/homoserine lactone efflux protein
MSPTTGGRPGNRPGGVAAFAPIVVAVCAVVLVREGLEAVFHDVNPWVAFIVALAVGWFAYTGVERWSARRYQASRKGGTSGPGGEQ